MVKPEKAVRPEKQEEVEALKAKFGAAKGIVLADYTGVTVAEVSDLRRKCRDARVEYKVVKNTLARIAAKEANLGGARGPFRRADSDRLEQRGLRGARAGARGFRQGIPEDDPQGRLLRGPGLLGCRRSARSRRCRRREILLGQVIGAVQAPIAQLVWCIESVLRNRGVGCRRGRKEESPAIDAQVYGGER